MEQEDALFGKKLEENWVLLWQDEPANLPMWQHM